MSKRKYNKAEYKERQEATMEDLFNKIKEGRRDVFQSDKWKNHLETMAKFHNYSQGNIMLIEMQNPHASLVAGYRKWQTEFDRNVKKGEKAIKILMPIQVKREYLERDKDGNPILDEEGKEKSEIKKFLAYKYTNVFDVSQTEGKELDIFRLNELEEVIENKDLIMESIAEIANENNCIVRFDKIDDAKGYYSPLKNEIVIKEGMPDLQTIKTAVHELAHSILHNPESEYSTVTGREFGQKSRKEIEAESTAYVVLNKLGLDSSDYSFGYIASWSSGKSDKELEDILVSIKDSSSMIIKKIENNIEHKRNIELTVNKNIYSEKGMNNNKVSFDNLKKMAKNRPFNETSKKENRIKTNNLEL